MNRHSLDGIIADIAIKRLCDVIIIKIQVERTPKKLHPCTLGCALVLNYSFLEIREILSLCLEIVVLALDRCAVDWGRFWRHRLFTW